MSMVLDLLDEGQLMRNIERQLMKKVKVVPRTTVHSRRISFSRSQYTLVLSRELTLGLSCDDAQRLVLAAAPLIKENFPTISKADTKKILKKRPCLTRSIKGAVNAVRRRCGPTTSTRHLLAITFYGSDFGQ